jgi:hypothetical protein
LSVTLGQLDQGKIQTAFNMSQSFSERIWCMHITESIISSGFLSKYTADVTTFSFKSHNHWQPLLVNRLCKWRCFTVHRDWLTGRIWGILRLWIYLGTTGTIGKYNKERDRAIYSPASFRCYSRYEE